MKAALAIIAAIIIGSLTASVVRLVKVKHACEDAIVEAQSKLYTGPGEEAMREIALKAARDSRACLQTEGMSRTVLSIMDGG